MSCFNVQNTGFKDGYPLFLGPDLGILDTVNVQYPQLEELYQTQLSQIWNEFEIDLTQDRMDMLTVPKETKDLMVKTLLWQTCADSVASRSIIEALGDYITNSEMLNLATIWSFFEVIHARTYSHIIKQTFTDPNEMIEDLYNDVDVMNRLKIVAQTFDDMAALKMLPSDNSPEHQHNIRCAILKTLTALFGLEAIAFMSSFAVTFAITETDVFQGIGQLVKLICRDEVVHTRMSFEIFKILKNDPSWDDAFADTTEDRLNILNSLVEQEVTWSVELFSNGGKVIGLNADLLSGYAVYMAKPLYDFFSYTCPYEVLGSNPLPYMDSYIDSTKVQAAAQEIQLTSYNVGVIADDNLDDLEL